MPIDWGVAEQMASDHTGMLSYYKKHGYDE